MPLYEADKATQVRQLRAAQHVLDFVRDVVENWPERGGRTVQPNADVLISAVFARSTRTYEAAVKHLGNRGFAEQGAMLSRSLFEDMLDAHWVSVEPDLSLERIGQHDHWSRVLRARAQASFPEYFEAGPPEVEAPTPEQEKKYVSLFGRYGDGSWTGSSTHARLKAVEECWDEGLARRQLWFIYAWVHKLNNETLHLSAYSLARGPGAPKVGDDDAWHFQLGPTSEHLTDMLFSAFWAYSQTVTLLLDHFGFELHDRWHEDFQNPLMSELRQSGMPAVGDSGDAGSGD